MEITLKIKSLSQMEALRDAVDLFLDMENDRSKDSHSDFTKKDAARLAALRELAKVIG